MNEDTLYDSWPDDEIKAMIAALPRPLDPDHVATDVENILWAVIDDMFKTIAGVATYAQGDAVAIGGKRLTLREYADIVAQRFQFYDDEFYGPMVSQPPELT